MVGFLTKYRQLLSILIIASFIGCHSTGNQNTSATGSDNKTAIEVFAASLHKVNLPFIDTCFDTVARQHINIPDSLPEFKKYGDIIGLLAETDTYVAILFSKSGDIQLPVVRTFNHSGHLISSQKLYNGICCGENEDCSGLSTVVITKNLDIHMKDSTQTFERDKNKSDKKENIKIKVKLETYTIETDGTIKQAAPSEGKRIAAL